MNIPTLTDTRESMLGPLASAPFFAAGIWTMWQGFLVGASRAHGPASLQPVGVIFKGVTRYVSPSLAHSYNLSVDLFRYAFLSLCGVIVVTYLVKRARARREA